MDKLITSQLQNTDMKPFPCLDYNQQCDHQCDACKYVEDGVTVNFTKMYENYEWLKTTKEAWMVGRMGFPVKVEIVSVDEEKLEAVVKTLYQEGITDFENLYMTEIDCPSR